MTDAEARKWIRLSAGLMVVILLAILFAISRIGIRQAELPLGFTALIVVVSLFGLRTTGQFLNTYLAEEQSLSSYASPLQQVAEAETKALQPRVSGEALAPIQSVPTILKQVFAENPHPLLQRCLEEMLRTLRQGYPLRITDLVPPEERSLSGPERSLHATMDIVMILGIAGTFLSILMRVMVVQSFSPNPLLTHVGPGLICGLMAVTSYISLGFCQKALLGRQSRLAEGVSHLLSEAFLAQLPRTLLSPDERLAATVRIYLNAQVEAITAVISQKLSPPLDRLATQVGILTQHSGTWNEMAQTLNWSQQEFVEIIRKQQTETLTQANAFYKELQTGQAEAMKGLITHLHEQYNTLQEKQALAHQEQLKAALLELGNAVEQRVLAIESLVSTALTPLQTSLPEVLRKELQTALHEAVELVALVRGQAGELASTVSQVSQNADRQLSGYKEWGSRLENWQERLEQVLTEGQQEQTRLIERWHAQAELSLGRVDVAFAKTVEHIEAMHLGE